MTNQNPQKSDGKKMLKGAAAFLILVGGLIALACAPAVVIAVWNVLL